MERDPVPILHEAGRAPEPVWTGAENLASTVIRSLDRKFRSQSIYLYIGATKRTDIINISNKCILL